jgi:heterotetrameric sarcosine oxidase gamma subunit
MSEFKLAEQFTFDGSRRLDEAWDGFAMSELAHAPAFWLAVDSGGEPALDKACAKLFGCGLPERGRLACGVADQGEILLAWVGNRQWLARGVPQQSSIKLEKFACLTEQSDGWVGLAVKGARSRDVLATTCPLDLHEEAFPTGSSARAPFEGVHGIVLCRDAAESRFELYFQRSSARSFVENLRHGAYSYCGERIAADD